MKTFKEYITEASKEKEGRKEVEKFIKDVKKWVKESDKAVNFIPTGKYVFAIEFIDEITDEDDMIDEMDELLDEYEEILDFTNITFKDGNLLFVIDIKWYLDSKWGGYEDEEEEDKEDLQDIIDTIKDSLVHHKIYFEFDDEYYKEENGINFRLIKNFEVRTINKIIKDVNKHIKKQKPLENDITFTYFYKVGSKATKDINLNFKNNKLVIVK